MWDICRLSSIDVAATTFDGAENEVGDSGCEGTINEAVALGFFLLLGNAIDDGLLDRVDTPDGFPGSSSGGRGEDGGAIG